MRVVLGIRGAHRRISRSLGEISGKAPWRKQSPRSLRNKELAEGGQVLDRQQHVWRSWGQTNAAKSTIPSSSALPELWTQPEWVSTKGGQSRGNKQGRQPSAMSVRLRPWSEDHSNKSSELIPRTQRSSYSQNDMIQFSSLQSLSRVRLSATPWIAARQASQSITNS